MAKPKNENSRRYYLAAEPCPIHQGCYDLIVTDVIRGRIPLIDLDTNSYEEALNKVHVHYSLVVKKKEAKK